MGPGEPVSSLWWSGACLSGLASGRRRTDLARRVVPSFKAASTHTKRGWASRAEPHPTTQHLAAPTRLNVDHHYPGDRIARGLRPRRWLWRRARMGARESLLSSGRASHDERVARSGAPVVWWLATWSRPRGAGWRITSVEGQVRIPGDDPTNRVLADWSGFAHHVSFLLHRASAALRAILRRCSAVSFFARALPPISPPWRPSS